jgi:hypothetical protein
MDSSLFSASFSILLAKEGRNTIGKLVRKTIIFVNRFNVVSVLIQIQVAITKSVIKR